MGTAEMDLMNASFNFFTRAGLPVRVYAIDAGGERPIHGAYLSGENWIQTSWKAGGFWREEGSDSQLDIDWDKTVIKDQ